MCCIEFGLKLRAVVRKDNGQNAIWYGATIEESVCSIRQCCFRRWDVLSGIRVAVLDSYDRVLSACSSLVWTEAVYSNIVKRFRRLKQLEWTFALKATTIVSAAAALLYCTASVACHVRPEEVVLNVSYIRQIPGFPTIRGQRARVSTYCHSGISTTTCNVPSIVDRQTSNLWWSTWNAALGCSTCEAIAWQYESFAFLNKNSAAAGVV